MNKKKYYDYFATPGNTHVPKDMPYTQFAEDRAVECRMLELKDEKGKSNNLKKAWITQGNSARKKSFFNGLPYDDREQIESAFFSKVIPTGISILFSIGFELKTPWYSKEEMEFGPLDNMICKDRTLGIPLIRPTAWKGNMRTMLQIEKDGKNFAQCIIERLFGPESSEEEDARMGRLRFYSSFFVGKSGEVLTPLTRNKFKKPVHGPIYLEVVPAGAESTFRLMYFPFDLLTKDAATRRREIQEDLQVVTGAIPELLEEFGFSAKKTLGWGKAKIAKVNVTWGNAYANEPVVNEKKDVFHDERLMPQLKKAPEDMNDNHSREDTA